MSWLWDGASIAWARLPGAVRVRLLRAAHHKVTLGVVGLIRDDADRVMVLDHRFRVRWSWGLPGGFVGPNELATDGLMRELREETTLSIVIDPEAIDVEHRPDLGSITVTYAARVPGVNPALALCKELRGGGFFSPEALPDGMYPRHAALVRRWASTRQRT